jgi:hypothetical protein
MVNGRPIPDRCVDCHGLVVHGLPISSPQALQQHYAFIGGLAGFPAGVERLVRTVHYLAGVSVGRTPKAGPLRFEPILTDFYPDLAYVCHDYWPAGPGSVDLLSPPWNPLVVAAWFLPQMALTGKPPNAELKGYVTTGNRLHGFHSVPGPPLPAWRLQEGSLSPAAGTGRPGVDGRADAFVAVPDGRVLLDYTQPCLLSTRGLVSMGVLLWGQPRKPW